mmetsp:Transcript_159196/g.296773  ORF Transcript_159196/g.296773 Transcript_159196/m.296773 type:complete len:377 (-) Transcript_159196:73-1203(-)
MSAASVAEPCALVGLDNGQLTLVSITSGKIIKFFDGHSDWILALEAHWPSMRAVSGGGDGSVYLWDLATGTGHQLAPSDGVRSCIRTIAAEWEPPRTERTTSPRERAGSATSPSASLALASGGGSTMLPACDSNRGRVLTGADSGRLAIWSLETHRCEKVLDFRLGIIASLAVDWTRLRALVGHGDTGLDLLDLEAGTRIRSLPGHKCIVGATAVSWSKAFALCGSGDGTLLLWDLRKGTQAKNLRGSSGAVSAVSAQWSSMRGATGATDGVVRLWNLHKGECLRALQGHAAPIQALAAAWDKGFLLSNSADGSIFLWRIGIIGKSSKSKTTEALEEEATSDKPVLSTNCAGAVTIAFCPEFSELPQDAPAGGAAP